MKEAFFEYIGVEDSLTGYQRSNRLVLLKALFSLIDIQGAARVSEVTQSYKGYYETRKRYGLIPDVGADIAIINIENATELDVLTVIKRHPYRVLNEKGFLNIVKFNNCEYFSFDDKLMEELTDSDLHRLARTIDRKLHLYFSKIDTDHTEMNEQAIICQSSITDVDYPNKDFESDSLAVESLALTGSYLNKNDQLYSLYNKFISLGRKYISLDDPGLGFTASDLKVITENDGLFYMCSSKRAILVIWIVEAIDELFDTENMVFTVNDIYEFLRGRFISTFNKRNLIKLLDFKDRIANSQFTKLKSLAKDKVNAIFTPDSDRTPYVEEEEPKEFGQVPISSTFRDRVEFLLGIDENDKSVDIELSNAEYGRLQLYDNAIKEAGIEICSWGYQFPGETIAIMEALSDFSKLVDRKRQRVDVLTDNFNNVASANRSAKIEPLITAYTKDTKDTGKWWAISNCVSGCKYVWELNKVTKLAAENNDTSTKLIEFLRWLQKDIRKLLNDTMADSYKNERSFKVVQTRALGATLEETGRRFGITRERIRQIEAKVERSFSSFYSRYSPTYILAAFSKSYIGFDENDIHDILGDSADIFNYFVKKKAYDDLRWADELSTFIVGDASWYEAIKKEIENLPEQILSSQIIDTVIEVKDRLDLLTDMETIQKIIVSFYRKVGDYFTKSRMTKKDMYKVIIQRYYPDGMKLFDDFEMMRFKTHLEDILGVANTDDTRAICTRITDFTILCDRGKYILPSAIQINSQLLDDIHQFVLNHERSNIMFAEIFERFKLRLKEESNIHNRYFLQGTLKYYWHDEFSFSRDTISRNSGEGRNIRRHIEDFVKAGHGTVTTKDIKDEFLGITDIVINMTISDNDNILLWGVAEYIHASLLNIDDDEAEKMKKALDTEIVDGTVSTSALYAHIYDKEPSLLNDNKIYNHTALFSVYRYLFPDEYSFSRPYINSGDTGMTIDAVIEEYVANFDELSIADLKLFFVKKHIKVMNFYAMLEKNCADFLRVDEDMLIRASSLAVTENVVDDVQNSIISTLGDRGYMQAKDYDDFFFFPYAGVKWTSHLLVAIIKKYCDKLSVSRYTVDHRYLTDIIYKNSLGIKNHEELISYAIRLENSKAKFENTADIESLLKTEGLIATTGSIPQTLYERGTVEITEFGELKIN